MGAVVAVVDAQGRGVRDENIQVTAEQAVDKERGFEPGYLPAHLIVGILMNAPVIQFRAFQPGEKNATEIPYVVVHIVTTDVGLAVVLMRAAAVYFFKSVGKTPVSFRKAVMIVISADIEQRFGKIGNEVIQIIDRQIAAGNDQINIAGCFFQIGAV